MSIFSKLFGGSTGNPSTPTLITPDDDPKAKQLRVAQTKNDWKTVQDFFSTLNDPDERTFYTNTLTDWTGRPDFFDLWVQASPNCSEAWLLRGVHGTQWAWEARTGAQAEKVPEEAWAIFFARLKQAWEDLNKAVELNPADPTPFGAMIPCGMGLQADKELVSKCLQATIARGVISWQAHTALLWYLCKKWHGSHEEMFEFARSVSQAAPEGHGIHALIPIAHYERWLYMVAFEKDAKGAEEYYKQQDVQREILEAYAKSLGSIHFRPSRATSSQSSFFAHALTRTDNIRQAQTEFRRLNNRVPEFPWRHIGDPLEVYSTYTKFVNERMMLL